jgi:hypothetical protein
MQNNYNQRPIIINIYSKENTIKQKYIFVGNVPDKLIKIFKNIEKTNKVTKENSKILKKFYGKDWSNILGLKYIIGGDKWDDILNDNINSKNKKNEDEEDEGEDEEDEGEEDEDEGEGEGEEEEEDQEITLDEVSQIESEDQDITLDEVSQIELEDQDITLDEVSQIESEDQEITLDEINSLSNIINEFDINKIISSPEKSTRLHNKIDSKYMKINFVFDFNLYTFDKIMDLKEKISIVTKIPIYRQHIWYVYNDRYHNLNYNIYANTKLLNLSIVETILDKKSKDEYKENYNFKQNYINNIPILLNFYNIKNLIQIKSNDTFSILDDFSSKLNINEFNLIDLNEFTANTNLNKIKNTNETEMIYYGFIRLFYPMYTLEAWNDYIINPNDFEKIYPSLSLSIEKKIKKFILETKITDEALNLFHDSKQKPILDNIQKNIYIGITSSLIKVVTTNVSNILHNINIRNLFDMFKTNNLIHSIKCSTLFNGKKIILNKVFTNHEQINKDIPINSILFRIKLDENRVEFLDFLLFVNGNYSIKAKWTEENLYNFDDIFKIISNRINNIINTINNMGNFVLIKNNYKLSKMTNKNSKFSEIFVSFIYRKHIKFYEFKILENILNDYINAEILLHADKIEDNSLEYYFVKGMHKFNANKIEKNIILDNYYSYLTNSNIKTKWDNLYKYNRHTTVKYRNGDIKISIENIKEDEFGIFYLYMLNIFSKLISHKKLYRKYNDLEKEVKTQKKGIKTLKQQDPILYDFKKIYNSPIIYSKICQKPYQPVIINNDELNSLSNEKKNRVVKYWNFTTNKDAYYYCPNNKFPYINFTIKKHPKDYCIPCCKIKPTHNLSKNNIKRIIYDTCINEHKYVKEKYNIITYTRYIMSYGKFITPGRICNLPEETLEPLLYESFTENTKNTDDESFYQNKYLLLGISQNINDIHNIGYINCLCLALDMSIHDLIKKIIKNIENDNGNKFRMLLDGKIFVYFKTYKDLINALNITFISKRINDITINKKIKWNSIFIDLSYYYLKINSIIFLDTSTKSVESFKMIVPRRIKECDQLKNPQYLNLFILKKKNIYNPIFYLNHIVYFKTKIIETKLFKSDDNIIDIICNLLTFNKTKINNTDKLSTNLSVYKKFVESYVYSKKYKINSYFVNKNNNCYYIHFTSKDNDIYVPVEYSDYVIIDKEIDIIFEAFNIKKYKMSLKTLNEFIKDFNHWIRLESNNASINQNLVLEKNVTPIYEYINIDKWIYLDNPWNNTKSAVIGFIHNNINYYHDPISYDDAKKIYNVEFMRFLYHPDDINFHIVNNSKIQTDERSKNISINTYDYYLYELLLIEFTSLLNKEKNLSLRQNIKKNIIRHIDHDFNKTINNIINIVKEYYKNLEKIDQNKKNITDDIINSVSPYEFLMNEDIENIIREFNQFNENLKNKKYIFDIIDNTKYNFDNNQINNLKTLKKQDIIEKLKQMSKKIVTIVSDSNIKQQLKNDVFTNMLISCQDKTSHKSLYCKQKKLIITKKKLDELLELLAQDILNPLKNKWLFSDIFSENIINYFKFIIHPDEYITIESQ